MLAGGERKWVISFPVPPPVRLSCGSHPPVLAAQQQPQLCPPHPSPAAAHHELHRSTVASSPCPCTPLHPVHPVAPADGGKPPPSSRPLSPNLPLLCTATVPNSPVQPRNDGHKDPSTERAEPHVALR